MAVGAEPKAAVRETVKRNIMTLQPVDVTWRFAGLQEYFRKLMPFFLKNLRHDKIFLSAGSLAFQTLLSIVPFLAVTLSVLRIFSFFASLNRYLEEFIFQNFIPSAGEDLRIHFEAFIGKTSTVPLIGGLLLFIIALSLISTIDRTLNDIWKVRAPRKPIQAFTLYWTVLTLGPVLIGSSLGASSYVWYTVFTEGPLLELKIRLISFLPFVNSLLSFLLLYMLVPNRRVKLPHAFSGAVAAALLFELSKKWFVFYVSRFATFEHIYGAISAVPLLFFWIYIGWLVVLTGAELVFSIGNVLSSSVEPVPKRLLPGLTQLFSVLGTIWRAQQDGSPVHIGTRVVRGALSATAADRIVDLLLQKGVVHETSGGELVVSADLYQMTLFDLYGLIPWELAVHEDLEGYDDDGSETFASLEKDVTVCLKETMAVPVALLLQDSTNQCI
ncbi:MAG: YihY family inner membrane protein [Chlorobium limicola]|uniref:UPF0761 membrane protein Clim_1521 n=2 Tax=Chlorobium limicola TaxID=1092 RepID=Y1521_CHLL2|nr:RecName: Full=UPF0761 membrane protein Clim_1521 [Chlorobium limicola DSM 245]ACD90571.1 ribonuclease BN [Chlorobium limicola DSM 245]NTV20413.1 YihY family inner membrane protein [Chlorobium limicola]